MLAHVALWVACLTLLRSRLALGFSIPKTSTSSQILEFIEPKTGVPVKLVGAMHYNPASIQLTADTIHKLALNNKLGSVLIESCDVRWNSTQQLPPFLTNLLTSEMRTAHDLALEYGRPVILGDQRINVTASRLGKGLKETIVDLVDPVEGWKSIAANITQARQQALPLGADYLGLNAFLEPRLLMAAPISLIKYPLSFWIKSPVSTTLLLALLFWTESSSAATGMDMANEPVSLVDLTVSLVGSALEIVLFARIFLKELLAERNQVLARNILEQCQTYQKDKEPQWKRWFGLGASSDMSEKKTVVAVLGMAHCNGIKKLLQEQQVQ